MSDLQKEVKLILDELCNTIIQFIYTNNLDFAWDLMNEYIKLSPNDIERYSLEAMLRTAEKDLEGAEKILKEGIFLHPISFDLIYNLAYIFEQKQNYLEAYNLYMKARYLFGTEEEKLDVVKAFERLVGKFDSQVIARDNEISTIVETDHTEIAVTAKYDELLARKELLYSIKKKIYKDLSTVLEIGFVEGMISKNLNYYGYEVTAVDRNKDRILNVIVSECQENILQPSQRVAKFYNEDINMEWVNIIPEFDVIIVVSDNNLNMFDTKEDKRKELLNILLRKAKYQVFIKVSIEPSSTEFYRDEFISVVKSNGYGFEKIELKETKDGYELFVVSKKIDLETFKIPIPPESKNTRSTIINIELSKCTDMYASNYMGDFHHFVETLKEYEKAPELKYSNSILKTYYESFQPKNLGEGLFGIKEKPSKLTKGWIGYPWCWSSNKRFLFVDKIEDTRPGGNHHFGPNTEGFGEDEFNRLTNLYSYLKHYGYHPEMFSDGYISGYLLVKDNDYRFIVTEGQHRIACLVALGYENILCRLTQRPEYPRIVDYKDVKTWAQVANGVYSRSLAEKVFNRFFEEGVGKDRIYESGSSKFEG